MGFPAHAGRPDAIGEVHARPHPLIEKPRMLIQLSFVTEPGAGFDEAVLSELSRRLGIAAPERQARHHAMKWGNGTLRWERHTEFSSYLWEGPLPARRSKRGPEEVAVRQWLLPSGDGRLPGYASKSTTGRPTTSPWSRPSMRRALLLAGRQPAGRHRHGLSAGWRRPDLHPGARQGTLPSRRGALAQRLIEIETYRTLAMLGLPLAQSLSGRLRRIEDRLAEITGAMRVDGRRGSQTLLADLTELAAELEADAAASLYRFGASRAYDGIVQERLAALGEEAVPGYDTWAGFLQRRVAPAMRTCQSVEARQNSLSEKISRATTLLRTWVDVEVEKQNRDLLASMNNRARLQLRLQQTVEGLSVAAVSYYVVGLVGYLAKGVLPLGHAIAPELVTAVSVPIAVLSVWWGVRRIRRSHSEPDGAAAAKH